MFILRYSCTICLKFVSASMISTMRRRQGIVIESTRGQQAEQRFENSSEGVFSLYFKKHTVVILTRMGEIFLENMKYIFFRIDMNPLQNRVDRPST